MVTAGFWDYVRAAKEKRMKIFFRRQLRGEAIAELKVEKVLMYELLIVNTLIELRELEAFFRSAYPGRWARFWFWVLT